MITAFGLLVTGCTDDPAPVETTPASTPSLSPSPTPTTTPDAPTPPQRPEAMSVADADGAAAAAAFFLSELYPYTYGSRDLTEWNALSGQDCVLCNSVRSDVETLLANDETSQPGDVSVEWATGGEVTQGQWYRAELRLHQGESRRYSGDGTHVSTTPGATVDALVVLTWDGSWTIDAVDFTIVGAS